MSEADAQGAAPNLQQNSGDTPITRDALISRQGWSESGETVSKSLGYLDRRFGLMRWIGRFQLLVVFSNGRTKPRLRRDGWTWHIDLPGIQTMQDIEDAERILGGAE